MSDTRQRAEGFTRWKDVTIVADHADEQPTKPVCDPVFEATFRSAYPQAVRVARRIVGDTSVAEDVGAEACTRAFVHWNKLAGEPWREAWILRVAANLALDIARRPGPSVPPGAETAEDALVVLRGALVAALGRLPRRQRDVVVLRYLSDLSEAETAGALGVSEGTVKTHLSRGLTALRRTLGPTVEEDFHVAAP
jgi:RNA polymerase sigma factor (sigma-70 family)